MPVNDTLLQSLSIRIQKVNFPCILIPTRTLVEETNRF
jgi:hypothetical protein